MSEQCMRSSGLVLLSGKQEAVSGDGLRNTR